MTGSVSADLDNLQSQITALANAVNLNKAATQMIILGPPNALYSANFPWNGTYGYYSTSYGIVESQSFTFSPLAIARRIFILLEANVSTDTGNDFWSLSIQINGSLVANVEAFGGTVQGLVPGNIGLPEGNNRQVNQMLLHHALNLNANTSMTIKGNLGYYSGGNGIAYPPIMTIITQPV